MPLQLRRDHLSLKYYARTKQNPSNPANQLVDDCIEYQIYNHKWNDHNIPYGFRVQNLLKDNDLDKIKLAIIRPDILEPIQILACRLKQKNIEVTIEWIPAHVGILGNEQVDKLAKLALSNDKIDLNLSLSANEFIAITTALYKKKWQARWDNTCSLWSRSINNTVNKKPYFYQGNRYHEKTITRLRLGTTLLPGQLGQYIRNVSPICNTCGIKEDIEHVLVNFINHSQARQNLQSNSDKYVLKKRSLRRPRPTLQELSGSVTQKWSQAVTGSTEGSSRRLNKISLRRSTTLQELSGSVTQKWSQAVTGSTAAPQDD
ncbi:unnamed protein product [Mytilus coruscus]|uniref:RNase H type-1 domain-containing protein n=1 Tax=Mytilus coruscus TaxID=42192 RepID=A0A6J8BBH4_MYTCO|nr:unnamed protein product [Mytilus coruscus]